MFDFLTQEDWAWLICGAIGLVIVAVGLAIAFDPDIQDDAGDQDS